MDIEKLAQGAGFDVDETTYAANDRLRRFAALVVEECAKVADEIRARESAGAAHHAGTWHSAFEWHTTRHAVAAEVRDAIRAQVPPASDVSAR